MSEHSPLGASGAERWLNCPGSVEISKHAANNKEFLFEGEAPEYRVQGSAAHQAAEFCLRESFDAWEVAGQAFGGYVLESDELLAVQVYLDEIWEILDHYPGGQPLIEYRVEIPSFHPDFYGTLDFSHKVGNTLFIRDYKHGVGKIVDVENNPQMMYYAFGLLYADLSIENVDIAIVQPRAFGEPIKRWRVSAYDIRRWAYNVLQPSMHATKDSIEYNLGDWCQFCPAKLICPEMVSAAKQASIVEEPSGDMDCEKLGELYKLVAPLKRFISAVEKATYANLSIGRSVAGAKLVEKAAHRVFKDGAEKELMAFAIALGIDPIILYEPASLKSPAQMEKLGAKMKGEVQRLAYQPAGGLTVVPESDKKQSVVIRTAAQTFANHDLGVKNGEDR